MVNFYKYQLKLDATDGGGKQSSLYFDMTFVDVDGDPSFSEPTYEVYLKGLFRRGFS